MATYFIATPHRSILERDFPDDATIVDPWRLIRPRGNQRVVSVGRNRPETISLLVPTRGRPRRFQTMWRSARDFATYPRLIEIVAYLDQDDPTAWRYQADYATAVVDFLVGERIVLSEMWNECYKHAAGEILMHCGDDIVFRTPGWDMIVRQAFQAVPDRIALVHGDDGGPNGEVLATHGFLHRRWVETVGYFVPPYFSSDWNDVWLTEVADKIGRRIQVPIVTEHRHYSFGLAEHDDTYREREERGRRDDVVSLYQQKAPERESDAEKLRVVLGSDGAASYSRTLGNDVSSRDQPTSDSHR